VGEMSSVLSRLQRGVASALPGCDYHDPANFEVERRIFHRSGSARAGRAVPRAGRRTRGWIRRPVRR